MRSEAVIGAKVYGGILDDEMPAKLARAMKLLVYEVEIYIEIRRLSCARESQLDISTARGVNIVSSHSMFRWLLLSVQDLWGFRIL